MTATETPSVEEESTKIKLRERLVTGVKKTNSFVVETTKKIAKKITDAAKSVWQTILRPPLDVVVSAVFGSAVGRMLSAAYFAVLFAVVGAWVVAAVWAVLALWEAWMFINVSPYLSKMLAFEVEVSRVTNERKRDAANAAA